MKCILLVRVSTEAQSFDEQEQEIYQMALADGYKESDITSIAYKESGIKLTEEERLGLNQMKQLIETGDYNCVYVWEISRIARTRKVLFSIQDYLIRRGIQLKIKNPMIQLLKSDGSIDEGADSLFTMFAQLAESEMRNKKVRFARGKKEKSKQGKYSGGYIPYGYTVDECRNFVINEEEAAIVRLIFDMYENGVTMPNIPVELEKQGITIKFSLISNILTNESYTGKTIKKEKWVNERKYPQIITEEQFNRCRRIAEKNNRILGKEKNIYFAKGLVRCPDCGSLWTASGSRTLYCCYEAKQGSKVFKGEYKDREKCTNNASISINILDSLLWTTALELEAGSILSGAADKIDENNERINVINEKLAELTELSEKNKRKKNAVSKAFLEDMLDEDEYNRQKTILTETSKRLKRDIEDLQRELEYITEESKELEREKVMSQKFKDYTAYKAQLRTLEGVDELEMSRIIHKHIQKVEIEPIEFEYDFGRVGTKKTRAKRIKVHFFRKSRIKVGLLQQDSITTMYRTFIHIPFDGKGGTTVLREFELDGDCSYDRYYYHYLKRFVDPRKEQLKEERRLKREAKQKK